MASEGGGRGPQPYRQPANSGHLSWIIKTPPGLPPECGRHPLADRASSLALHHCFQEITAAFDAIEPVLRQLAPHQFEEGFARKGAADVLSRLHLDFPHRPVRRRLDGTSEHGNTLRALHIGHILPFD